MASDIQENERCVPLKDDGTEVNAVPVVEDENDCDANDTDTMLGLLEMLMDYQQQAMEMAKITNESLKEQNRALKTMNETLTNQYGLLLETRQKVNEITHSD